jgi:hypothetical protein
LHSKNYALNLLDLHPGSVKFSDLRQKMVPIMVPGLEYIEGVFGQVMPETLDAPYVLEGKSGPPLEAALLWAHMALYLEDQTDPFESPYENGKPRVS